MTASTRVGAVLVGSFLAVALAAPLLAPFDPAALNLAENLSPPSLAHPFGQDRCSRIYSGEHLLPGGGLGRSHDSCSGVAESDS